MKCCESSDENAGKTSCFPDEVTEIFGSLSVPRPRRRGVYVSAYPGIRVSAYPSIRVSEYPALVSSFFYKRIKGPRCIRLEKKRKGNGKKKNGDARRSIGYCAPDPLRSRGLTARADPRAPDTTETKENVEAVWQTAGTIAGKNPGRHRVDASGIP
jgi:hypothetical protein